MKAEDKPGNYREQIRTTRAGNELPGSLHMNSSIETKKNVFEQLTLALACSARRHGSDEVSISKCDVTWTRVNRIW